MAIWIGTSGWQYADWRGTFYPEDLPVTRWLERYARAFTVVEVNNTFYRLPEKPVFEDWAARTPAGFVVVPKMSRFLTHVKRLKDPGPPVRRFLERARALGDKLGPVLLQLPPTMKVDAGRLAGVLDAFPRDVRVALEPRHGSWFTEEVFALLEARDAALCFADRAGPITPLRRTATWGYVRFHGGSASPPSCYSPAELRRWARRLASLFSPRDDVFAFFNNDAYGCALRDAVAFARAAARAGLSPTHVPAPREVKIAAGRARSRFPRRREHHGGGEGTEGRRISLPPRSPCLFR